MKLYYINGVTQVIIEIKRNFTISMGKHGIYKTK